MYIFKKDFINEDALEQTDVWFDARGKMHKIEDMSTFHLLGAMRKLGQAFRGEGRKSPLYLTMQATYKRKMKQRA